MSVTPDPGSHAGLRPRPTLENAPGRNRTYGLALRRRTLYPLSYRRVVGGGLYRLSAVVRRQGERALEGGPVVHRLAVRDDHVLERQLQHRPQRRHHPLGVPRRAPDAQLAVALRQRVGEEQRPRPGRPERRLVAPAAVVEGHQPAGQLAAGLDRLDLGLGNVVRPEERRPVRVRPEAAHEEVDVAHVVGLQDRGHARRPSVQPGPDLRAVLAGIQRVDDGRDPLRRDPGGRDRWRPVGLRIPVGMVDPPHPQALRDIDDLRSHRSHHRRAGGSDRLARVELQSRVFELEYHEPFVISRSSDTSSEVVQVAIRHGDLVGYGEGAPDNHYDESIESAMRFLGQVEPLLGDDPLAIEAILGRVGEIPGEMAAKCAVDGALHDLLGKVCGQPLYRILGLDPTPPPTSYTISIDSIEGTARRAAAASAYHALKIKVGGPGDLERVRTVRAEAPDSLIRVDANEAWSVHSTIE